MSFKDVVFHLSQSLCLYDYKWTQPFYNFNSLYSFSTTCFPSWTFSLVLWLQHSFKPPELSTPMILFLCTHFHLFHVFFAPYLAKIVLSLKALMKSSSAFMLFSYLADHHLMKPILHLTHKCTSTPIPERLNAVVERHKTTPLRTWKEPLVARYSPLPCSPYLFSSNSQHSLLPHCFQVRNFFL